jgi:hypothetical protein
VSRLGNLTVKSGDGRDQSPAGHSNEETRFDSLADGSRHEEPGKHQNRFGRVGSIRNVPRNLTERGAI